MDSAKQSNPIQSNPTYQARRSRIKWQKECRSELETADSSVHLWTNVWYLYSTSLLLISRQER